MKCTRLLPLATLFLVHSSTTQLVGSTQRSPGLTSRLATAACFIRSLFNVQFACLVVYNAIQLPHSYGSGKSASKKRREHSHDFLCQFNAMEQLNITASRGRLHSSVALGYFDALFIWLKFAGTNKSSID